MKIIAITPDKKRDYTTELVIEGFQLLGYDVIASDIGNGIFKSFDDNDILNQKNVDFAIAFFGKVRDNRPPKYHLLNHLKGKMPIAYIDGSEWTYTGYRNKNQMEESLKDSSKRRGFPWIDERMFQFCDLYFKRECYQEDYERGIIPLPFGLMNRHIINDNDNVKKDIDIMCVFGQHETGLRKEVTEYCLNLKRKTKYNIVVSSSLSAEEYKNVLKRSRIVIDAWGGGDNCDRFYEAIGAKSCCLYQRYNVIVENPFLDFIHAVSYSSIDDFSSKLDLLLNEKEICNKIGNAGFNHGMMFHSSLFRAKSIAERISSL